MNNTISIKIEGEEDQVLTFRLPSANNGDVFNSVNGLLEDQHYSASDEIASLLGNPSSESLTMYKSEPIDQDEYQREGDPEFEGQSYSEFLSTSHSDAEAISSVIEPEHVEKGESSSSSSDSDDNSSGSDGDDNDSSAKSEDESRDTLHESESSERDPVLSSSPRGGRNGKSVQFKQRRKFENEKERRDRESKMIEIGQEKSVENFVHDNIEDYLNRRGFRHPMTLPTIIPKGIFASIILPETARMNTVVYGPQYEPDEILDQVEKLWKFYWHLKEYFAKLSTELKPVLVPTLLYFFQDCCISGVFEVATQLHSSFSNRFLQEDRTQEAYIVICNLARIVRSNSFGNDEYLQNIRHREFRFVFSEQLFEKLKGFLCQCQSPVLIHLFTSKFIIQLEESATLIETFLEAPPPPTLLPSSTDQPDSAEMEFNEHIPPSTRISVSYSSVPVKTTGKLREIQKLQLPEIFRPILFDKVEENARNERQEGGNSNKRISPARKAIYLLRNSVEANIPSIRLHTLSGRPICGAVSNHGSLLAFGMSTSVINVCFSSKKDLSKFNIEKKLNRAKTRKLPFRTTLRKRIISEVDFEMETTETKPREEIGDSEDEEVEVAEEVKMINPMYGHEGPIYDMAFHPKTRLLFSVGHDCTLRAWDLNTFKCRCVYRGHLSPIWCLDITDSGHMIVTGSMDTTARIWVIEKTEYVRLLAGHYFDVDCVKFHPNEAFLATGSVDKSVRLWSVSDGSLVRVFTGATSGVSTIAFHNSGKYIVGGGEDSFIRIWDIAEGEILAELPSPIGPSCCHHVTLCQNMLAAAFEDNTVRIWNLRELFGGNHSFSIDAFSETSSSSSDDESPTTRKAPDPDNRRDDSNDSDWETISSCSITEDELEPIEMKVSNNAVRLPAPKIIRCDSSSIIKLQYRDFGHLHTLGSQIEISDKEEEGNESSQSNSLPEPITIPANYLPENELEVEYLPESVRPMLATAGIHRWPIPIERLSSSDEENGVGEGIPVPVSENIKSAQIPTMADFSNFTDSFMRPQQLRTEVSNLQ